MFSMNLWQILVLGLGFAVTVTNAAEVCGVAPKHKHITVPSNRRGKQITVPSKESKIIQGVNAEKGAWPWMAVLQLEMYGSNSSFCAGALLNSQWVLTAAHCTGKTNITDGYPTERLFVLLGEYDASEPEDSEIGYGVSKYIVHEEYISLPDPPVNDIALVKLKEPVKFDAHKDIKPLCLPDKIQAIQNQECYIAGWGITDFNRTGATILQEAFVTMSDQKFCEEQYSWGRIIDNTVLCAGYFNTGACKGDSGSALVCKETKAQNGWYAAGITSGGFEICNVPEYPTIYTRVDAYIDWIKKNMK